MSRRSGLVWWQGRTVGSLREDERGLLHFAYHQEWLDGFGFPVSVSLPLSNEDAEVDAHSYFSGLLPEGEARQRICRQLQIAEGNDAGLLFSIGHDCAGALSILPSGVRPDTTPDQADILDEQRLNRIIKTHGALIDPRPGGGQRFSLAGAQDKFTVVHDSPEYRLPTTQIPSTHLMKFETVKHVCFSEYMATQIARGLGLPTITMEYHRLSSGEESIPWLMLDRYDRTNQAGRTVRLHQEDLNQALGYPTFAKYQQDGGPSLSEIGELITDVVDDPAGALALLRDWQIFNLLIGNWDGHAKNLSLLYPWGSDTPVLAPFYDLVSIEHINKVAHAHYSRDLALSIGSNHVPEEITKTSWQDFAKALHLPVKPVLKRVAELADQLPSVAERSLDAFQSVHGEHQTHQTFLRMLEKRGNWVLRNL